MSRNAFAFCRLLVNRQKFAFNGRHSAFVFCDRRNNQRRIIEKTRQQIKETKNVIREQLDGINENVFTLPNGLCLIRIGLTPYLGYLILFNDYKTALITFVVAGATDLLDGSIARTFPSQKSVLGSLLDPFADKLLVATLFATLTYTGLIPVPLTGLIILRDGLLVSGAAYLRYKSLPEPKTLSKYFNFKYATVQMKPTTLSKVNTALQLSVIAATLGTHVFGFENHPLLSGLFWVTAATTVASGFGYMWGNNTYKFIRRKIRVH
ncbi:cardiolipin synthase (CMP-forming)-like protein [Leptotrombidium deliense]|uniref:cardiolipin synthase (CMP-forming) n=1 Tax=Leptotrombidium deliense TaxID=299467 RepID=A0A443S9G1_9ACAR|nr:cardiolipin synthase (CMP-forming)-like protein [Leptotrombidium deliense]